MINGGLIATVANVANVVPGIVNGAEKVVTGLIGPSPGVPGAKPYYGYGGYGRRDVGSGTYENDVYGGQGYYNSYPYSNNYYGSPYSYGYGSPYSDSYYGNGGYYSDTDGYYGSPYSSQYYYNSPYNSYYSDGYYPKAKPAVGHGHPNGHPHGHGHPNGRPNGHPGERPMGRPNGHPGERPMGHGPHGRPDMAHRMRGNTGQPPAVQAPDTILVPVSTRRPPVQSSDSQDLINLHL